jgi:hypothetical protein
MSFPTPKYRVLVYAPLADSTYGIGAQIAEFAHAKNIGYADTLNDVPDSFFTIDQDDPQLPQIAGYQGRGHVRILRDDVVVWAGWFGMEHDANERDVIFVNFGYLAGLYFLPSDWNVKYTAAEVGTIVSDGWTRAKTTITNSPLNFVATGTIQSPVTTSGGSTSIVLPTYAMFYKRLLFMLREMAALSVSDTTNTVVFEITHSTPTFNFWKNRGVDHPDIVWAYGDAVVSGFSDYQMPVDRRTSILGVGSSPTSALLRYEWTAPGADIAEFGARIEPIYLSWVRDQTELTRTTTQRGAIARKTSVDLTIKFAPNSVVPPGGTGAGFRMSDTVRVRVNRGTTQVDATRLITGFRVLVLGGNEYLRVVTRPALGS